MRDHQPPQQQEFFSRVNMYLDRALSREDEQAFLQEVKHNQGATDALHSEQSFRELIRNNVPRHKASPDLIQVIKEKIRKAPA